MKATKGNLSRRLRTPRMSASPTREPSSTFHYWSSRGADAASRAERHRRAASAEDAALVLPLMQQATAQFSGCWKIHT